MSRSQVKSVHSPNARRSDEPADSDDLSHVIDSVRHNETLREMGDGTEMSFQQRLEYAIGLVSVDRWASFGRSQKQMLRYIDGADIPLSVLNAVSLASGVPLDWLVSGRPTFGPSAWDEWRLSLSPSRRVVAGSRPGAPTTSGEIPEAPQSVTEPAIDEASFLGELPDSVRFPQSTSPTDFALLPRFEAKAAAGAGRLAASEEISEMLAFRRDWLRRIGLNPAHAFLLVADGDSMHPTIPDGALMLVDGSIREPRDIKNGMIYVVVRAGAVLVKRIQIKLDDSVVLISDNPIYERETISRGDMNDLHFAGRVVWFGRAV